MDWTLPIVMGVSTIGNVVQSVFNKKSADKANSINQQNNEFNQSLANKQFDYQKYLNANQMQIQAEDAKKAGINPIAMTGGSLQTFSGSASSNSQTPYQSDALSNIVGDMVNAYTQRMQINAQKDIADNQNSTALEVARIQAEASKYSANKSFEGVLYASDGSYAGVKYASDSQSANTDKMNATQLRIAELNSQTQKEIARLSTKSSEYISQKNREYQAWIDSERLSLDRKMAYANTYLGLMDNYLKSKSIDMQNTQFYEQLKLQREQFEEVKRVNNHEITQGYLSNLSDFIGNISSFLPTNINVNSSSSTTNYDSRGRVTGRSVSNSISHSSSRR